MTIPTTVRLTSASRIREERQREIERVRDTTIPDATVSDEPTLDLQALYDLLRLDIHEIETFVASFDGECLTANALPTDQLKRLDRAVVLLKSGAKEMKRLLKRRGVSSPSRLVKTLLDSGSPSSLRDPLQ